MSHYPSSAELASFRRSIDPDHWEWRDWKPAEPAYDFERKRGIGYSGGSPTLPVMMYTADDGPFPMGYAVSCAWADAYDHSWARKAAGAMRSRWAREGRWGVDDMYTFSGQNYHPAVSDAQRSFAAD